jgi:hypothetical protein
MLSIGLSTKPTKHRAILPGVKKVLPSLLYAGMIYLFNDFVCLVCLIVWFSVCSTTFIAH